MPNRNPADLTFLERFLAKQQLEELLPLARKNLEESGVNSRSYEALTPAGQSAMPRMLIGNVKGVMIEKRRGGWVADLLIVDEVGGTIDIMGSPESHPFRRRENAVEFAVSLLSIFMANEERLAAGTAKPAEDDGLRWIEFFGVWFSFTTRFIKEAAQFVDAARADGGYSDEVSARARLSDVRRRLWPESAAVPDSKFTFPPGAPGSLPEDDVKLLGVALMRATLAGIVRHPKAPTGQHYEDEFPKATSAA